MKTLRANPTVSFIVPCYKLAHLLPECVHSILAQTYEDFEVLIMDDCSPDDTPTVAQAFHDPRVRHIRNESNLGHLRNYNKGIDLARGEYIWLISADDRLRQPYILEKHVNVMESNPKVGYVICPAVELVDGVEKRVGQYSVVAPDDKVFRGHEFLKILLDFNPVAAPAAMVRRSCYARFGKFPLDLPYAGDQYLWSLFALHYDVAFQHEPMVNYRLHSLSITDHLRAADLAICAENEILLRWRLKAKAEDAGYADIVKQCCRAIAFVYARQMNGCAYRGSAFRLSPGELGRSLKRFARDEKERWYISAHTYASLGDLRFQKNDMAEARACYERALRDCPWMARVWAKWALTFGGSRAGHFRRMVARLRQRVVMSRRHSVQAEAQTCAQGEISG